MYNQNSYFIWLQTKLVPRNTLWSFTFKLTLSLLQYTTNVLKHSFFHPYVCTSIFSSLIYCFFFNLTLIGKVLAEKSCWLWISDFFFSKGGNWPTFSLSDSTQNVWILLGMTILFSFLIFSSYAKHNMILTFQ